MRAYRALRLLASDLWRADDLRDVTATVALTAAALLVLFLLSVAAGLLTTQWADAFVNVDGAVLSLPVRGLEVVVFTLFAGVALGCLVLLLRLFRRVAYCVRRAWRDAAS